MKKILLFAGLLVAITFMLSLFILDLLPASFIMAGFYAILAFFAFRWNKELTKVFVVVALLFFAIGLFFQAFPGFGA